MKTSYKNLNVYQQSYKVAIDLHHLLLANKKTYLTEKATNRLKDLSRNILGYIAEGCSQRTAKARRFFNFKAMDSAHRIELDLEYLLQVEALPDDFSDFPEHFKAIQEEIYRINKNILEPSIK